MIDITELERLEAEAMRREWERALPDLLSELKRMRQALEQIVVVATGHSASCHYGERHDYCPHCIARAALSGEKAER